MDAGQMNRLRWKCSHRALREMDLLLGDFLDSGFAALTPPQVEAFVALAEMEDQDLWPLVCGRRDCVDPVQAEVVAILRSARRNH